jgi:glycosyltransferase involved in cell wall biosynthesis
MSLINNASLPPETQDFSPLRIQEVEIGTPLPAVSSLDSESGQRYQRAFALVRLHTQPLGVVTLDLGEDGLTPADYAHRIWENLGPDINKHLRDDGLPEAASLGPDGISSAIAPNGPQAPNSPQTQNSPQTPNCLQECEAPLSNAPFVSVVVATHDRPDSLAQCVESLLAMEYPSYEIVIVDNAPSSSATADMVRDRYGDVKQVRLVTESTPGLANAHNRGLMEVEAPIVAFTDDDVLVDTFWLARLVKGFDVGGNVGCVTGMILPAELQTPAQLWIEQYSNFNKGFTQRIFDMKANRPDDPLYPYAAGRFGSGANMAFRTSVLRDIGGFDSLLGAGSGGFGGDDLAAFFDVVIRRYTLVYEPSAMIWHRHHREYGALRKLRYHYGAGLTAYLMKTLMDRPSHLLDLAFRIPHGLWYALNPRSPKNRGHSTDYARELASIERKGMLLGPFAYLRGRWKSRKSRRRHVMPGKSR